MSPRGGGVLPRPVAGSIGAFVEQLLRPGEARSESHRLSLFPHP
ncbi:MAG TPA: hypothetical protein VLH79_06205 [Chthonomonadales bacterium]|nr:hypothetical protein [Chthonomonadales bacterium]